MKTIFLQRPVIFDLKILKATTCSDMNFASLPIYYTSVSLFDGVVPVDKVKTPFLLFTVFSLPHKTEDLVLLQHQYCEGVI